MPRTFDFTIESSASVEQIHSAFSQEAYWRDRLATGGIAKLDSLRAGPDGSVTVVIVQDLSDDALSGLIAKFYPKSWRVVHTETWSAIGDGSVRGEISIASHGAPGSGFGTALLTPAENGTHLTFTATVEFKVPLVGGKVENMVGRQLPEQMSQVQRFTAEWIAENA